MLLYKLDCALETLHFSHIQLAIKSLASNLSTTQLAPCSTQFKNLSISLALLSYVLEVILFYHVLMCPLKCVTNSSKHHNPNFFYLLNLPKENDQ